MDIKGNMLPAKSISDIPRKSCRKRKNTERETGKKKLNQPRERKHVLARPGIFSNKTLTSL
jgi:hypothetical protein